MFNDFFYDISTKESITLRLLELDKAKVGFYSVGLYPASLAYNCVMQNSTNNLLLAPREGRDILGAFSKESIHGMDKVHISNIMDMAYHYEANTKVINKLSDLILRCDLVILSSNSNHIENDLKEACHLKEKLNRNNVVLSCLSGSFTHDKINNQSYVLCEKYPELAFFSGFHRHGALRNPLDSFTANFCHPNTLTSIIGARILDKLSPNIQVSSGVHNIEGQYIKASKNIGSILAGYGHTFHKNNAGLLPTLLTLLLEQCLDQAATVSIARKDRSKLYSNQGIPLTELGYGVQKIEASLIKDGDMEMVRDHTFSQLTAMIADVRGSMMQPVLGSPTRNFQAGIYLAELMTKYKRCPNSIDELYGYCKLKGLSKGSLEGLNALKYWPDVVNKYNIPLNDASMNNLLYISLYGDSDAKELAYIVLTQSRELTSYCQESVRFKHRTKFYNAFDDLKSNSSIEFLVDTIYDIKNNQLPHDSFTKVDDQESDFSIGPYHIQLIASIEELFHSLR